MSPPALLAGWVTIAPPVLINHNTDVIGSKPQLVLKPELRNPQELRVVFHHSDCRRKDKRGPKSVRKYLGQSRGAPSIVVRDWGWAARTSATVAGRIRRVLKSVRHGIELHRASRHRIPKIGCVDKPLLDGALLRRAKARITARIQIIIGRQQPG